MSLKTWVLKNGPALLTGFVCSGVVTTGYLTYSATLDCLSDTTEAVLFVEDSDIPVKQTVHKVVKKNWKKYIPAGLMALFTMGCAIGAHKWHISNETALTAAALAYKTASENLEKKFSEKYGENAVKEVKKEIAEEKELRQKVDKYALNSSEKFKIWEPYSEQWIYADLKDILWVELCANKRLLQKDEVYLDDILRMFGLKGSSKTKNLAWSYEDEMFTEGAGYYGGAWIELTPQIVDNPNGTYYYQLEYGIHPNDISYLNDSGPLPY